MTPSPESSAQRPERKPSDWSPRPIPQPAPERRTADPKTPTLKELAERERQRASLLAGPSDERPEFTNVGTEGAEPDDAAGSRASDADAADASGSD